MFVISSLMSSFLMIFSASWTFDRFPSSFTFLFVTKISTFALFFAKFIFLQDNSFNKALNIIAAVITATPAVISAALFRTRFWWARLWRTRLWTWFLTFLLMTVSRHGCFFKAFYFFKILIF